MPTPDHRIRFPTPSDKQPPSSSPIEPHSSTSVSNLLTRHQYHPDHILQHYEIYIPPLPSPSLPDPHPLPEPPPPPKIWLIHIHGGAWRDPTITALNSFTPTLSHLLLRRDPKPLSSPPPPAHPPPPEIAGYISLSYRLSRHPSYPQPAPPTTTTTPSSELRTAQHPDHIVDIVTALRFLQAKYGFGPHYMLLGHSCGGTLGWEVAMSRSWDRAASPRSAAGGEDVLPPPPPLLPPRAIVSVCAVYDLPALVRVHEEEEGGLYRRFVEGAFGADERVWEAVSPAWWRGYGASWGGGESEGAGVVVAVLAHSREDGLVEWGQVEGMERGLRRQQVRWRRRRRLLACGEESEEEGEGEGEEEEEETGDADGESGGWNGDFQVLEIKGQHDEVWRSGEEMARAVRVALDMLGRSSSRSRSEEGGSGSRSDNLRLR